MAAKGELFFDFPDPALLPAGPQDVLGAIAALEDVDGPRQRR
ncbi:hypothetical protein [Specibacter sp. NPDC078692]